MPTPRFTPEELRQLHDLARQWAEIVSRRAFGDDGPGLDVDFRTFEQIATAAARGLTEGTLQLLLEQQADKLPAEQLGVRGRGRRARAGLEQQADKLPAEQPCPECGQPCPTKPRTRPLTAQGATVEQAERIAHCPACRRDFFPPPRVALGLDEHGYSSSVVERVVNATARFSSFRDATDAVVMSGIALSESQVRRLAHKVGAELIAERDRQAVEHRRRQPAPRTEVVPEAVVAEVDGGAHPHPGGRFGCRGSRRPEQGGQERLPGHPGGADPCPEVPESFRCPRRVRRLVGQMRGQAGEADPRELPGGSADPAGDPAGEPSEERWSPERLVRTCVASLEASASFGRLVAAEAHRRHFGRASRRAFVADGAAYNWSIHAGYFGDYEPIVDLLHVLCYLYSSATAVGGEAGGWWQYLVWMRACWQGRAVEVLVALDRWQDRPGLPPPGEAGSAEDRRDPRRAVWEARS